MNRISIAFEYAASKFLSTLLLVVAGFLLHLLGMSVLNSVYIVLGIYFLILFWITYRRIGN